MSSVETLSARTAVEEGREGGKEREKRGLEVIIKEKLKAFSFFYIINVHQAVILPFSWLF